MKNEEAVRIFMENSAKVAARPIRVNGITHMNEVLGEILANESAIYCPGISELESRLRLTPSVASTRIGMPPSQLKKVSQG